MASGVNKVIIVGNLGNDPEVRYSTSGMAITTFSVAVNERVKDGDAWKDHTEWFRVVTFGKTAENCGQYLQKGRQVYVEGVLRQKKYKDKEGVEKYSTELLGNDVKFLGGAPGAGGERGGGGKPAAKKGDEGGGALPPSNAADQIVDDDLPFIFQAFGTEP